MAPLNALGTQNDGPTTPRTPKNEALTARWSGASAGPSQADTGPTAGCFFPAPSRWSFHQSNQMPRVFCLWSLERRRPRASDCAKRKRVDMAIQYLPCKPCLRGNETVAAGDAQRASRAWQHWPIRAQFLAGRGFGAYLRNQPEKAACRVQHEVDNFMARTALLHALCHHA